jgi:Reverse transcriptase (RNA-dependent DNA polymerase)
MDKEIGTLNSLGTWNVVRRADVLAQGCRGLKSTWAFRKKRLPNGDISKYKARFCVRGDMQVEGEDFFESYAPVVQWSSVRLMLIMSIVHGRTRDKLTM